MLLLFGSRIFVNRTPVLFGNGTPLNVAILVYVNRSNAFEVSSMDGGASVVLYSENKGELLSWYSAIKDRVVMLLEQSVSSNLVVISLFLAKVAFYTY